MDLVHRDAECADAVDAHALHHIHGHDHHGRAQRQQTFEIEGLRIANYRNGRCFSRFLAVRDGADQAMPRARGVQHRGGAGCERDDAATVGADGDFRAGVVVHAAGGRRSEGGRGREQRATGSEAPQ